MSQKFKSRAGCVVQVLCCSKVRGIVLDYNLQRLATTYVSFKSLEVESLSTYSLSALFQAKLQLFYSVCKWDLSSDGQVRFWALSFILRSLQVQPTAVYSFCQLSVSFWGHLKSFQVAFSWRWTSLGLGLKLSRKNELQCIFQELWATFTKLYYPSASLEFHLQLRLATSYAALAGLPSRNVYSKLRTVASDRIARSANEN